MTLLFHFQTQSYLLSNLAVADFLMGIYMMIIGAKNESYRGDYARHDISWRQSNLCTLSGFLSTFSGELSVLTLTAVTVDRFIAISLNFKMNKLGVRKVKLILLTLWIWTLTICVVPFMNNSYFGNFYGQSEMCLPVPIASERQAELVIEWRSPVLPEDRFLLMYLLKPPSRYFSQTNFSAGVQPFQTVSKLPSGWEYSVFVFVGINGLSFLAIAIMYVWMFVSIKKTQAAARSPRLREDVVIARKMLLIVGTDAACWLPVIGIGIYCLQGNTISMRVSGKVSGVLIAISPLPLSSCSHSLPSLSHHYYHHISGHHQHHHGNSRYYRRRHHHHHHHH